MPKTTLNKCLAKEVALMEFEKDNGLIINDRKLMMKMLETVGYDALIVRFKIPFIDMMTKKYRLGTTIEDIVALYRFNSKLKLLTFDYIGDFELGFQRYSSFCFCEAYGKKQEAYLDPRNYNAKSRKYGKEITRFTNELLEVVDHNTSHENLVNCRRIHKNIPLKVVMETFSFRQLSTFYKILQSNVQSDIAKNYPGVARDDLEQFLKSLSVVRNICAHNGLLYCLKMNVAFPDTEIHQRLNIPKHKGEYICGKRDYFGVVIAFKCLFTKDKFEDYMNELKELINEYLSESKSLIEHIFSHLGFPKK